MNAINYMLRQSTYEVLSDGTVSFFYTGKINKNLVAGVIEESSSMIVRNRTTGYSNSGESFSWGVSVNETLGTMALSYNDYTIPMQKG